MFLEKGTTSYVPLHLPEQAHHPPKMTDFVVAPPHQATTTTTIFASPQTQPQTTTQSQAQQQQQQFHYPFAPTTTNPIYQHTRTQSQGGNDRISPTNTTTSSSLSPTSTHTPHPHPHLQQPHPHPNPHHHRQLRAPKSPLYIPAVLRPTDPPARVRRNGGQLTPPRSGGSSIDGTVAGGLSRRGTADSGKAGLGMGMWRARGSLDLGLGLALGLGGGAGEGSRKGESVDGEGPTRRHWMPDTSTPHCTSPTTPSCTRPFNLLFHRRHHCRRCGHIFCSAHSSHLIPLDHEANFHTQGTMVRSCDDCFHEFARWNINTNMRRGSETDSLSGSASGSRDPTIVASENENGNGSGGQASPRVMECMGKAGLGRLSGVFSSVGAKGAAGAAGAEGAQAGTGNGSMAQSVPRDWNWSTF